MAGLDLARSAALVGMAVYHFGYDLEMFGVVAPATMLSPFWAGFARAVAGSFLFLAGIGLWLAHGRQFRRRAFLVRLAKIGAAALLVSLITRAAQGEYYVFFGILHSIALSSVLALIFLRLPVLLTVVAAVAVGIAPRYVSGGVFDAGWLVWTGLSGRPVLAVDFVPTFPWLAPVLLGLAVARIADAQGLWARWRRPAGSATLAVLGWPGRHSLLVYLIHQPVLIGLLWLAIRLGAI
ncbi:MAG: heparan-alpha-glucosaminide N-acetyltransferase [Paracoccaceae bacterium]